MPTKTIIAIGFAVCVAAGAGIALLLQDINKHQFEAGQTFFKVADRIIVDGNEQIRTQTRGKSNCP